MKIYQFERIDSGWRYILDVWADDLLQATAKASVGSISRVLGKEGVEVASCELLEGDTRYLGQREITDKDWEAK